MAANIANGIRHAFKEFRATEVLIGMHMHPEVSQKFWGAFHQSLFNGLNSQIIMARLKQPLSTIRRIKVAVPSRAQFEPGFYRWLERLCRMAVNMECHTEFYGREDVLPLIEQYVRNKHQQMRVSFTTMVHWAEMPNIAATVADDQLFIIVTARKGVVQECLGATAGRDTTPLLGQEHHDYLPRPARRRYGGDDVCTATAH